MPAVLRLTAFGGRAVAVGVSAGAHAALLLTSLGHPAAVAATSEPAIEVEVSTLPQLAEDVVGPSVEKPVAGAPAWHTHTHPYPVPPSHDLVPHDPDLVHAFAPLRSPAPAPSPVPEALHADDAQAPRFTITLGPSGDGASHAISAAGASPTAPVAATGEEPLLSEASVDTRARLAHGEQPVYPELARADGIEGTVGLELIVDDAGVVESARVVRPVGHGLDDAALAAVRGFRFVPATKSGHPVHVRMAWTVTFAIR